MAGKDLRPLPLLYLPQPKPKEKETCDDPPLLPTIPIAPTVASARRRTNRPITADSARVT